MQGFASRPPDMDFHLIEILSTLATTVTRIPELEPPCRFIVVRSQLQNRVTRISRYCRVGIEVWSIRGDGTTNYEDAFDLAAEVSLTLENVASNHPIVLSAEVESGPATVADPVKKIDFQFLTVLLEVAV